MPLKITGARRYRLVRFVLREPDADRLSAPPGNFAKSMLVVAFCESQCKAVRHLRGYRRYDLRAVVRDVHHPAFAVLMAWLDDPCREMPNAPGRPFDLLRGRSCRGVHHHPGDRFFMACRCLRQRQCQPLRRPPRAFKTYRAASAGTIRGVTGLSQVEKSIARKTPAGRDKYRRNFP